MVTKHFFKVLLTFMLMIALGMAGILYVSTMDDQAKALKTNPQTAADCTGADC